MEFGEPLSNAIYTDRRQAGRHLARKLVNYHEASGGIVLGLPRGGIPVAYEVAKRLHLPLDVLVVRKLGFPGHEELAMGAIAHGGVIVLNEEVAGRVDQSMIDEVKLEEQRELEDREKKYRGYKPFPVLKGSTVIVVDDGLATGASMRAAVKLLRQKKPKKIIAAVPVSSPEACEALTSIADEVVCAITPRPFFGVGMWYEDFSQTTDTEVLALLNEDLEESPARQQIYI